MIGYDNSMVNDYQERAADSARIAEDFAAKGDYQRAVYRLTDALRHLSDAISEMKHRG
jgi:hypothetical protein